MEFWQTWTTDLQQQQISKQPLMPATGIIHHNHNTPATEWLDELH